MFAAVHGATPVATPWRRWAVGPLLRGGLALRHYRTQILLVGILRAVPGDASARSARRIAHRGVAVAEPADPRAAWRRPPGVAGPIVVDFVGYEGFFGPLLGHEVRLLADLRRVARPRWLALADRWGDVPIAINARCGKDFLRAASTSGRLRFGDATPVSWFVRALRLVRETSGRSARAFVVSDGTPADLAPLLAEPDVVLVRPGCAISDLLVLARARVLLASGSSSFSAWGAFLGRMPAASHPGQPLTNWGLPRGADDPARIELDLETPDERFLSAVGDALRR